jgi:ATP-dependent DNA helicase DinG
LPRILFLTPAAADSIRLEIARARGNEVCFLARIGDEGDIHDPTVVARGHRSAVLAAVRDVEPGMLMLHNHPSGGLEPSEADLSIAAELYAQGAGMAITDNDASELYVVVEPKALRDVTKLDETVIDALLAPGGLVSKAHAAYEDRPTQRDMARAVARRYNEGGIAIAEAGTGTGKSIAYLIPAIAWAASNRERTVVSTNTINLQEQLVEKDLPFLRRTLGEAFRFALVKGRRNYISIRRAKLAVTLESALLDIAQRTELKAVSAWLEHTRDGSLQDLPFTPTNELWDEVASDADVCLRAKCPHFEQCFYQRARRDAASADILVVNHHLLFSDLAVRQAADNYGAPAVLPAYKRVILDEAHNLEDAATAHLGANVSRRAVARILGRLERRGKGILAAVEVRLLAGANDLLQQDALRRISDSLRPSLERAREHVADLFGALEAIVLQTDDGLIRLADDFRARPEWVHRIEPAFDSALLLIESIAKDLEQLRARILIDERWASALQEQILELESCAGRLRGVGDSLRLVFTPAPSTVPMVRWLERRSGGQGREANVAACAAPVDISQSLREALFDRVDTAILTSATLATKDGFDFLRRRIGLGAGLRVDEAIYPSPFDYESQTMIAIPTDLPMPHGETSSEFNAATARVVKDVAEVSDGGLFVLFTSYRALRAVAQELRTNAVDGRWPLFVQGEGARARLIDRFTDSGRGILLGVASFWEGVDVPGHPLRGLVIAKLPFKVPSEPLTAARIEAIEADGGNSFYEYMLPHAALRLKQGFGRLIRSRTDRGAVVLLDRRVLDKSYGRYFLSSLPPAPVRTGGWRQLRTELEEFYAPVFTAPCVMSVG